MTSSGKIRIYELSKDLSLDNKDVLDAARKLAIAAKSHSSSISNLEANQIKDFLKKGSGINTVSKPTQKLEKAILSVKKSPPKAQKNQNAENIQNSPANTDTSKSKLRVPQKPKQTLINSQDYASSSNPKPVTREETLSQSTTLEFITEQTNMLSTLLGFFKGFLLAGRGSS